MPPARWAKTNKATLVRHGTNAQSCNVASKRFHLQASSISMRRMPHHQADPLAIPQLFNHQYDIDPLITAFASDHLPGDWTLDTRNGTVHQPGEAPNDIPARYRHTFSPLPATFLHTLSTHFSFRRLTPDQQAEVGAFLASLTALHQAIPQFNQSLGADFVRERVKEAAIDWLTETDLLPPSMRHLPAAPKTIEKIGKIIIES